MVAPRKYLPSLNWLLAAEAVARLGSVSEAAQELSLTQSAVSRQIQNLENQLGITLFERERKRLYLTTLGDAYITEIRGALGAIGNAGVRVTSNPDGGVLELAILPGFGTHWLAPRLPRFLAKHPGITLNLTTRMRSFDFALERFDAAISFGTSGWPGSAHAALMDECVVPVASPEFIAAHQIEGPNDLLRVPLLRLQSRPKAWLRWLGDYGLEAPKAGMVFDQFATMGQAAAHGLGVALLPDYMADDMLQSGALGVAAGAPVTSVGSYALIWPEGRGDTAPLVALRHWLLEEAGADAHQA